MSYVIVKTEIKDGEEYWDITFEDGYNITALKEGIPDPFQLVDQHCWDTYQPLPTEWRYE